MEKKKLDFSPFLTENENVLFKTRTKGGNGVFVETAICFLLWLLTLAGDCFLIGASYSLKKQIKLPDFYPIIFAIGVFIHIIPFAAWLISALKKIGLKSEKWFALTNKRVAIISGIKPVTVSSIFLNDVTAMSSDKNSITLYLGDEKIKLKQMENVDGLARKIEDLIFVEDKNNSGVTADLQNNVSDTADTAGDSEKINSDGDSAKSENNSKNDNTNK